MPGTIYSKDYTITVFFEVPLQSRRKDLYVGRLFRYFGSCWDQGTGEDPSDA